MAEGIAFDDAEAGGANEILRVVRRVLLVTVAAEVEQAVVHARTVEGRWNKSAVESDSEQHIAAWVKEKRIGAALRADLLEIGRDPQEPAEEIDAVRASLEHVRRLAAHGALAMFAQVVAASESNCSSSKHDLRNKKPVRVCTYPYILCETSLTMWLALTQSMPNSRVLTTQ